ncbi:MAG: tRNA (N6-threonylcarbamoyladenosine(37)-N6)-methyltransferase TrmO [Gammaproteobacteria bacterium]|nr:tRNA (N6-threonylcarbamoyladenosine(37)-N6)-methyltransferase TrmO [Gammaproteobacteria bacterium]
MSETRFQFDCIGIIRSPCKEKFAVPRQAGLAPALIASIDILPAFARPEAFKQIEGFSHLWLISVFHQAQRQGWQPTVRPPRLGGNNRVGVFASRAPYRPNPIGMSVVELQQVITEAGAIRLLIRGCDLIDGTPILDIKPYLAYADSHPQARGGYTENLPPPCMGVEFSPPARQACEVFGVEQSQDLAVLITQLIQHDPRPAYIELKQERHYAFRLFDYDVRFHINAGVARVDTVRRIE